MKSFDASKPSGTTKTVKSFGFDASPIYTLMCDLLYINCRRFIGVFKMPIKQQWSETEKLEGMQGCWYECYKLEMFLVFMSFIFRDNVMYHNKIQVYYTLWLNLVIPDITNIARQLDVIFPVLPFAVFTTASHVIFKLLCRRVYLWTAKSHRETDNNLRHTNYPCN